MGSAASIKKEVGQASAQDLTNVLSQLGADERQKIKQALQATSAGMPEDAVVVVFGGLGRQGGSVAEAVATMFPQASIRIVTRRNPEDEKAKAACKGNITVHTANMNEPETLKPVLAGAYAVFLVTAFWPKEADGGTGADKPLNPKYEEACALNVLMACENAGVSHLIFSTLDDTSTVKEYNADGAFKPVKGSGSDYIVPHFDGKGKIMAKLNTQTKMAVDFVMVGFYYGNWFGMKPAKGEDGNYALYLPLAGKKHYMVSVAETGKVVAPLLRRKPAFGASQDGAGNDSWPIHGVIGEAMAGQEIANAFSEVCLEGEPVNFVDIPVQAWIQNGIKFGMPEAVATDFGNMFGFFNTDYYCSSREKEFGKCKGKMTGFRQWLGQVKGILYPDAVSK